MRHLSRQGFEAILQDVAFPNVTFRLGRDSEKCFLQIESARTCNVTGEPKTVTGRKWRLSGHMTKSEVVQTALKAVLTFVEHEAREQFTYCGVPIFDPHYDVDRLLELRRDPSSISERRELKREATA